MNTKSYYSVLWCVHSQLTILQAFGQEVTGQIIAERLDCLLDEFKSLDVQVTENELESIKNKLALLFNV